MSVIMQVYDAISVLEWYSPISPVLLSWDHSIRTRKLYVESSYYGENEPIRVALKATWRLYQTQEWTGVASMTKLSTYSRSTISYY